MLSFEKSLRVNSPSKEGNQIKILPEVVINQIAAGEVVERPASVVKELIENSIDAGSRRISVDLVDGGKSLIRVVDDGEGMNREDSALAFERHATSKLFSEQDLHHLQTLGFRGEALPSIASISRVRLVTMKKGGAIGTEVRLEGGSMKGPMEAGAPEGTLIEVEDLFYNTPARRKFLKSATTEISHISHLILQQALAYPSLHFRLNLLGSKTRRELYNLTPVKTLGERILQAFGEEFFSQLIAVEHETEPMKLHGFISRPLFTRGGRNQQELFINNRPVRSPGIQHAVYEAYESLLSRGRHPITFLFLKLDPQAIDINVHPSKKEIRFRDSKQVHDWLKESLQSFLVQKQGGSHSEGSFIKENRFEVHTEGGDLKEVPSFNTSGYKNRVQEAAEQYLKEGTYPKESFSPPQKSLRFLSPDSFQLPDHHPRILKEKWFPLTQIHHTFILAVSDRDLYFVDQHTAHERVLFERFLHTTGSFQQERQRLLIPFPLELSLPESLLLKEHQHELEGFGIDLDDFGERTFMVRSMPALVSKEGSRRFIMDIVDDLSEQESAQAPEKKRKKIVATIACHSAVRAQRPMKMEEMETLLFDLQKTDQPFTCPHGRPTLVQLEGKTLDRLFWR
ncbi:MAG TPA: DNA mismatch repair endonuclease MutL [Nitrospiria bacterium]|jgi:DNA mismatch repair protein MutL